jgi:hypothetical protein
VFETSVDGDDHDAGADHAARRRDPAGSNVENWRVLVQRRPAGEPGCQSQRPEGRIRRGVIREEQASPELSVVLLDRYAACA